MRPAGPAPMTTTFLFSTNAETTQRGELVLVSRPLTLLELDTRGKRSHGDFYRSSEGSGTGLSPPTNPSGKSGGACSIGKA